MLTNYIDGNSASLDKNQIDIKWRVRIELENIRLYLIPSAIK